MIVLNSCFKSSNEEIIKINYFVIYFIFIDCNKEKTNITCHKEKAATNKNYLKSEECHYILAGYLLSGYILLSLNVNSKTRKTICCNGSEVVGEKINRLYPETENRKTGWHSSAVKIGLRTVKEGAMGDYANKRLKAACVHPSDNTS